MDSEKQQQIFSDLDELMIKHDLTTIEHLVIIYNYYTELSAPILNLIKTPNEMNAQSPLTVIGSGN